MSNADAFADRLLPGERILWSGTPKQGLILSAHDILLIPFSLAWGGFAIFWEVTALQHNAPLAFRLFGVPFVLVGLFIILGRFLLDARLRSTMSYALTDRRVLIARSGPWPNFQAISLDRLPEATLSEGSKGRGTIRFGDQPGGWGMFRGRGSALWVAALDPTPRFLSINDARHVFDLVQGLTHGGAP